MSGPTRCRGLEDIGVILNVLARLFFNLHTDFCVELHIQVYGDRLLRRRHLDRRGAGGEGDAKQHPAEGRLAAAKASQSRCLPPSAASSPSEQAGLSVQQARATHADAFDATAAGCRLSPIRSEEHTSELQSLMR